MPWCTTTSSRDANCATAVTRPVARDTRTRPGVFSNTTSAPLAPSSTAPTGLPSPVATATGVPATSLAPARTVRSLPRALSGISTVVPRAPMPSTPCVGDDVVPRRSHGENELVAGSTRSRRLGICCATRSLPSARTTMPSGPFASAIVRSTSPVAVSSTRRPPSRSLNHSEPDGVTTMSSGSPLTRTSTGSVLNATAAGHPLSDAEAGPAGVCVARAVPVICDGEPVVGAHATASMVTRPSAPKGSRARSRCRAVFTTARVSGCPGPALRLAPQRAANALEIRQSAALALEPREVLIAHQPADVSPQLTRLVVTRNLDDDRAEYRRASARVENDCGNTERFVGAHDVVVLALHLGPRAGIVERARSDRAFGTGLEQGGIDHRVVVSILATFVDGRPERGVETPHGGVAVRVTQRDCGAQRRRTVARRCRAALVTLVGDGEREDRPRDGQLAQRLETPHPPRCLVTPRPAWVEIETNVVRH